MISLMVYKRTKQRQEVDYGQKLRQQRVDGAVSTYFGYFIIPRKISKKSFFLILFLQTKVNPFKLGFITLTMAVVLTFLVLHRFVVSDNIQVKFEKSSDNKVHRSNIKSHRKKHTLYF